MHRDHALNFLDAATILSVTDAHGEAYATALWLNADGSATLSVAGRKSTVRHKVLS